MSAGNRTGWMSHHLEWVFVYCITILRRKSLTIRWELFLRISRLQTSFFPFRVLMVIPTSTNRKSQATRLHNHPHTVF